MSIAVEQGFCSEAKANEIAEADVIVREWCPKDDRQGILLDCLGQKDKEG